MCASREPYLICFFAGRKVYRDQMLLENKKTQVLQGKEKRKIALNRGDNSKLVWADYVTAL